MRKCRGRTQPAVQDPSRCTDRRRRPVLACLAFGLAPTVRAQATTRRIGYLATTDPAAMSQLDVLRRLAGRFVVRLLNGARAQDLPVEQPSKFELVVNAATARALRLSLPRELLERADHIVE